MNIFVDGSYSPQKKIGVGAYIIIDSDTLSTLTDKTITELKSELSNDIMYQIFEGAKGSTDVEQKILEVSLQDKRINQSPISPIIFTDCQKTKFSKHHVISVKGHTKQKNRTGNDKIFDVVDKAARKKLRQLII